MQYIFLTVCSLLCRAPPAAFRFPLPPFPLRVWNCPPGVPPPPTSALTAQRLSIRPTTSPATSRSTPASGPTSACFAPTPLPRRATSRTTSTGDTPGTAVASTVRVDRGVWPLVEKGSHEEVSGRKNVHTHSLSTCTHTHTQSLYKV